MVAVHTLSSRPHAVLTCWTAPLLLNNKDRSASDVYKLDSLTWVYCPSRPFSLPR